MRLIVVGGTAAEKTLAELAAFAALPENHYWPTAKVDHPPGDDQRFVRLLSVEDLLSGEAVPLKVVFTHTHVEGKRYRQASISIGQREELPEPDLVCTVLSFLGFSKPWGGITKNFYLGPSHERGVVMAAEVIERDP